MGTERTSLPAARVLAASCVAVACVGAYALVEWLGVRFLLQRVPQQYDLPDLLIAFLGTVLVWGCAHAAVRSWTEGRPTKQHAVVVLATLGLSAYSLWPTEEYGYFVYEVVAPSLTRDLLLLAAAVGAGLALPTAVARVRARRTTRRDQVPLVARADGES